MVILFVCKAITATRRALLSLIGRKIPSAYVFSFDTPLTLSWLEKSKKEGYPVHSAKELFLGTSLGDVAFGTLDSKYIKSGISLRDLRNLKRMFAADDLKISVASALGFSVTVVRNQNTQ